MAVEVEAKPHEDLEPRPVDLDVVVGLTGAFLFPVCLGGVVFGGMMMLTKSFNNDKNHMTLQGHLGSIFG
jgi:hypothetical protein